MVNTSGCLICLCCLLMLVHKIQCQGDTCPSDISFTVNPDADVKFTVVTSLRQSDCDKCGKGIVQSAWQNLAVMQWLVEKMNYANFTGNVKIVTQLSLLSNMNVADHLAIGEALGEIASKEVLIVGSGFATHKGGNPDVPTPQWAVNFRKWLHDALFSESYSCVERKAKLLACEREETEINKAHPSLEHFLPILMCSAAAGYRPGRLLYSEFVMSSLLNEHYIFPTQ